MNPTVELVSNHKKANMRKSEFLMLEALKSAPHLNDDVVVATIIFCIHKYYYYFKACPVHEVLSFTVFCGSR